MDRQKSDSFRRQMKAQSRKPNDCKTITKIGNVNKILCEKRLCFNCNRVKHRAAECRIKRTCQAYKRKHQLSLWKQSSTMMVSTEGSVIYPIVVFKVNNITCRGLSDTGAGSSYASSPFLEKVNIHSVRKKPNGLK